MTDPCDGPVPPKSRAQPTLDWMVEIVMKDHLPLWKTAILILLKTTAAVYSSKIRLASRAGG